MAAITRTSTSTVCDPPTRSNRRSCSTRSSFACMASGISPISSRKMVPPCASSKRPLRWPTAPVNAPFSWPNSSLSSSVSGRAAQLTATNGLPRRGDASWMARATSSLPVPVSPKISTVLIVCATWLISSKTSCIRGLLLRMLWKANCSCSFSRSAVTSSCSARSRRARWITSRRCSRLTGLVRKSTAPSRIACTVCSIVPKPVVMITSAGSRRFCTSSSSCRPSTRGIFRSVTMTL